MFEFSCPKCSRICPIAEGLKCSTCDSTTRAGMHDNFNPKHPEIAVPRGTDVANGSKNQLVLNSISLNITVLEQNIKRNKSSDQIIKKINQPNDQSRQEICKRMDRKRDWMKETSAATNRLPSGNSHSVDIQQTFLNQEFQWKNDAFQVSQKDNASISKAYLNSESHWNTKLQCSQKDSTPVNKSYLYSEFQGSQINNKSVNEAHLNNESRWNVGDFQGSQKNIAPVKILESIECVAECAHSGKGILAVPGPSGLYENQDVSIVQSETLKFNNTSDIQSAGRRINPEIFPCKVCSEDIGKHTVTDSSVDIIRLYGCCVCKYVNYSIAYLQKHIDIHCPKRDCDVCLKEYTEGSLHVMQVTCKGCNLTLKCMTELNEHLLVHGKYYETNCWACSSQFSEHITIREGKNLYYCCMCGFKSDKVNSLYNHNRLHRPQVFCKTCREEYPEEEKDFHSTGYDCVVCKEKFQCRTQLEDHYRDVTHISYFNEYCRLCNKKINDHIIKWEEKIYFKCCDCKFVKYFKSKQSFKRHLFTHAVLPVFKCGNCGKRYLNQRRLSDHSMTCIPSPFECGTCRARFPSEEYLTNHRSKKHSFTGVAR